MKQEFWTHYTFRKHFIVPINNTNSNRHKLNSWTLLLRIIINLWYLKWFDFSCALYRIWIGEGSTEVQLVERRCIVSSGGDKVRVARAVSRFAGLNRKMTIRHVFRGHGGLIAFQCSSLLFNLKETINQSNQEAAKNNQSNRTENYLKVSQNRDQHYEHHKS